MSFLFPGQRGELNRFLWSFRGEIAHVFCFTALTNVLMLTPTLYMLQVFDRVLVSQSLFTLLAVTLMLFFFVGVMSFSEWVRARLLVRLGVRIDTRLNPRVFRTAFALQNEGKDKEAAQLFSDLSRVRQFLTGPGILAILDAPWSPVYIFVLFLLDPSLGLLAIVFCAMLVVLAWISAHVMKAPLENAGDAARKESAHLYSKLRHAPVVESMGMQGNMRKAWIACHWSALTLGRQGLNVQSRMQSITRFTRFFQQSLCLAAGALLVIFGRISPGGMIAANALMGRVTHPVDALMNNWKNLLAARRSYFALEEAFKAHPPQEAFQGAGDASPGAALVFEHVSASAEHRPAPILQDISFTLPAGAALAVMGPSGSGKSTLARVMLGIWSQVEGEALYDGVSLRALDRATLGAELGYLPQDVELLNGTIAENIARFGEVDANKVIAASQAAGVHEMILHFPKGYDTGIGDGGMVVSGGQRQRIGLARALYGDPRLIVLDEPNANLDDAGDRALLQAVLALKTRGATLVLITHRPQIVAAMDLVLTLSDGKMTQFGKPRLMDAPPALPAKSHPVSASA
jgi:ATP-binding cassette subfamily C exporter for protease/lipase